MHIDGMVLKGHPTVGLISSMKPYLEEYSNIFRFLRLKIVENTKHSSKYLGLEILQKNFNYYRDNLREVIEDAKIRGIEVTLISLNGLFEVGDKSNFSNYPQFIGLTQKEIEYRQSAVILINDLKKKLAGDIAVKKEQKRQEDQYIKRFTV